MNNRFVVILVAIVAVFLGAVFFLKKDANAPTGSDVVASEHTTGEGTSGVTLVEYGDFQCPACGAYYPILQQVKAKYGDQIKFQFRHFPIVNAHPNAMAAHRAAEAASLQDKFWEMHDLLYENQASWETSRSPADIFKTYAAQIGLDTEQYNNDFAAAGVAAVINKDMAVGKDLGVAATPTFFLNDKLVDTSTVRNADDMYKIIDAAISEQQNN